MSVSVVPPRLRIVVAARIVVATWVVSAGLVTAIVLHDARIGRGHSFHDFTVAVVAGDLDGGVME